MKALTVVGMALLILAQPVQAIIISDGDFTNWSFSGSGTGSVTVTRSATGGNPGAYLDVTTVTGASETIFGGAIKNDFTLASPFEGADFIFDIEVFSGPGSFGQGQRLYLLAEQGSDLFRLNMDITGFPNTWNNFNFSGQLNASQFLAFSGPGTTTLDFSSGVATRFGFAAGNTNSGTLSQFYDNFRLEIIPQSTVPAPATLWLMLIGVSGLGLFRYLKKANS